MDEERRTLVRRLAADPQDPVAGPALARLLARASGSPGELVPGGAALVVRASVPRPAFAWRKAMDRAVGRVAWLRQPAKDGLSYEVDVPEVGRFHVGAKSLAALPELGRRAASGTFRALDGSGDDSPEGRSVSDLRRLGRAVEDEPGPLGPDGFTHAQRLLLAAVPPGDDVLTLGQVAEAAGFVPENNRTAESAFSFLYRMAQQNPRARRPLLTLEAPVLLPGDVVPGPLDTGPWTIPDLFVARLPGATELAAGLPWAVVAGIDGAEHQAPPHDPAEVASALLKLLANPRAGLDEIAVIEGPDFPGGGEVGPRGDVGRLYATGAGTLSLRAAVTLRLPARVVVETPWPDEAPDLLERVVREAWQAGRLDGIARITEERPLAIELERGVDRERLIAFKHALQELLPLEHQVAYRMPSPLVAWLRAWIDDKRRVGLDDKEIKRRVVAARAVAGEGRRTRVF